MGENKGKQSVGSIEVLFFVGLLFLSFYCWSWLKLDSCMLLLGSKMYCTERSEAAVQINILASCLSSARRVPGPADV